MAIAHQQQLGHLADADQAVASPVPAAAPPAGVDTLVVELDGGMVHLRRAWSGPTFIVRPVALGRRRPTRCGA